MLEDNWKQEVRNGLKIDVLNMFRHLFAAMVSYYIYIYMPVIVSVLFSLDLQLASDFSQ